MSYRVAIRNNVTGEIRFVPFDREWDAEADDFMWTEGNYCCDCNLSLFWFRAGGYEPTDEECRQYHCDSDFFRPLYAEMADGSRVRLMSE